MDAWARDRAAADASLANSVEIGRKLDAEPWKGHHWGWCRKCDTQGPVDECRVCYDCHGPKLPEGLIFVE